MAASTTLKVCHPSECGRLSGVAWRGNDLAESHFRSVLVLVEATYGA